MSQAAQKAVLRELELFSRGSSGEQETPGILKRLQHNTSGPRMKYVSDILGCI